MASLFGLHASVAVAADYAVTDLVLTPGADSSGLNFNWITSTEGTGQCVVEIAKASAGLEHSMSFVGIKTPADTNSDGTAEYYYCAVTVGGLKNQVDYVYRVGDGEGRFGDAHEYSTRNRNKFGFAFVSDAQIGATNVASDTAGWVNTVSVIHDSFPETAFILSTGDQIENPGNENEWAGFFSPPELASIPVAPAPGSHDEQGKGRGFGPTSSLAYDYHFNLPNETEHLYYQTSQTSAGDYYFTYGDALFMVLTTDSHDYVAHAAFMEAAVAANPNAKWRIAAWHYTTYTAASRPIMPVGLREAMAPMMDAFDIDLVLMGHDHTYCRTHQMLDFVPRAVTTNGKGEVVNPLGTVYVSANSSSGSKFYQLAPDVADPAARFWIATYGQPNIASFSYIELDANSLTLSTYLTDTLQSIDTYTIRKAKEHHGCHGVGTGAKHQHR